VTQPANGVVVITGGGTGLTYKPNANYCNNPPGTFDTFTYTLTPGSSSATVSVSVICVNDPPVAGADTFDFIGNTELRVDLGAGSAPAVSKTTTSTFGVLDNDSDPVENNAITVTGIVGCADITAPFGDSPSCATANGGTVVMEANGRFSFKPKAGDTAATDSFQYTIQDNGVPAPAGATGTVTLRRLERVWYVKNDAVAGGLGRSHDPFDTLAEAQTASLANDYIFVYFGDGTTTGQAAGILLKNGQHLIGEHAGLSVLIPASAVTFNGVSAPVNIPLVTAAPGNRPLLDNTAAGGNAVSATDAIPAEVTGLSLAGNTNAIDLTTNAAFAGSGTFSIQNNVIRSAGAEGIDVNEAGTGTLTLGITGNSWNTAGTHTGNAVDINRTGGVLQLNFSSNTNILSAATAVNINGGAIASTTITGFAANTVHQNTGGTGISIANAKFDLTPGTATYDQVNGGATVIGASGNGVGGSGMLLSNVSGDLAFTNLQIFADGGAGLRITGTGAVNTGAGTGTRVTVGAGVAIFEAIGGPAVDATNATIDLQPTSIKSTNSATTGVALNSVTGTFSAGSGSSISNAVGTGFQVGSSNATISYAGTISATSGAGVSLTNNTGSTIGFTGTLSLSTGSNPAFVATGGGTVTSTDTASTLTTTTGTALNVANTTIGAGGLKFRSISAGTAASGPTNGIILNTTGSLGGLTVSGTGSAGSGGTIQKTTSDSVSLTSTKGVNLSWMNIQNSTRSGILGTTVTDLSLSGCSLTGNGTTSADCGIKVTNLAGSSTFSNTTVTGSALANVFIDNTASAISSFSITGGSYSNLGTTFGGNSILLDIRGTSTLTTGNISGITLSNNKPARAITIQAQDTATISDFTVQSSTFTNNGVQASFEQSGSANLTFKLLNNPTMTMTLPAAGTSHAVNVASSSTSTGGLIQGRIQGNVIGNAATPSSGSPIGNGIRVLIQGRTQASLLIDGNTIRQVPQARGIDAQFLGPLSIQPLVQSDITVTNNDVNPQDSTGFPTAAIYLAADSQGGSPVRMRSDVRGNTVPAGAAVDSLPTFLIVDEVAAAAEAQLVDTAPASANCTAQLTSTNTGSSSAASGCALIAGPISTPP
jgi:hypothetical protein